MDTVYYKGETLRSTYCVRELDARVKLRESPIFDARSNNIKLKFCALAALNHHPGRFGAV